MTITCAPIDAAASSSAFCIVTKYGLFSSWNVMPIFSGAACAALAAPSASESAAARSARAARRPEAGVDKAVCIMVVSVF